MAITALIHVWGPLHFTHATACPDVLLPKKAVKLLLLSASWTDGLFRGARGKMLVPVTSHPTKLFSSSWALPNSRLFILQRRQNCQAASP